MPLNISTFNIKLAFVVPALLLCSTVLANNWDIRQRLIVSHEQRDTRPGTQLNPGTFAREDKYRQLALDNDLQWRITPNLSSSARLAWIAEQSGLQSNQHAYQQKLDLSALLLEGELSWHSRFRTQQLRIGRIKPQWSQGFNWPVTDLLKPNRSRPSFDQDQLRQQQGHDMINLRWRHDAWSASALIAELDSDEFTAEHQSAMRLAYEGDTDVALIWHNIPALGSQWGISISRLLTDATTFRFESAFERQRDLLTLSSADGNQVPQAISERDGYWKILLAAQHSRGNWDLRSEYLFNQHGYSDDERRQLDSWSEHYQQQLNSPQAASSFEFFANASQAISNGQLARNALYLMFGNGRSPDFWQWQQSVQWNLDDNSQYHQWQLGQRWTDAINSRLQLEYFEGDSNTEYGRLPNRFTGRLTLYWSF